VLPQLSDTPQQASDGHHSTHWIHREVKMLHLAMFNVFPLCTLHVHLTPSELLDIAQFDALDSFSTILNALSLFFISFHPLLGFTLLFPFNHRPTEGFSLSNESAMSFSFTFGAIHSPHRVQHSHLTI